VKEFILHTFLPSLHLSLIRMPVRKWVWAWSAYHSMDVLGMFGSINSLLANFVSVRLDTNLQCKAVLPFIAVVFIGINSISTILDAWAKEHFVCWVKLFFLTSVLIRTTERAIYMARLSPDRFTIMEDRTWYKQLAMDEDVNQALAPS